MLNAKKHREVMLAILKRIYHKESLRGILGFKGGTAAMLFYNLPRFSVDLDFDLLDESKKDLVLEEIKKIIEPLGTIKDLVEKHFTLFGLLSYGEGQRGVKIEISKRGSGARHIMMNYLGSSMLVVVKEDMVACKLAALSTRKRFAVRDMYDMWYFLNNHWDLNADLLSKQTKVSFRDSYTLAIKRVEAIKEQEMLSGLGELLTEKQKVWVKNNLKQELLFLLKLQQELSQDN